MNLRPLRPATVWLLGAILLLVAGPGPARAQEGESFSFDLAEVEKKPYTLGGYLEGTAGVAALDEESAAWRLRFFDREEEPATLHPRAAALQLQGSYEAGPARFETRLKGTTRADEVSGDREGVVEEGFLALAGGPSATVEVGKRVARWGTGYAFNPVAFVERPKNPDDPDESREGFIMATGRVVQSFSGPVGAAGLTLVALPVDKKLNDDFGPPDEHEREWNLATRLYLLVLDTDIDLLALGEGTRAERHGVDFSRNLAPNLEVHGEWARTREVTRPVLADDGSVSLRTGPVESWLLGTRYLTTFDLTIIAEHYHDGSGYTADELETFYRAVDTAWKRFEATERTDGLERARSLQEGAYGRPNPGRDYAYLRLSQKEPFGWLYGSAALTSIANGGDRSYTLTPEVSYTGVTNLEVRLQVTTLQGERFTEYGEKLNDGKAELRLRWFF